MKWDTCPVCRRFCIVPFAVQTDRFFRTTTKAFTLDRCVDCGTLFLNPPPPSDELKHYYPHGYWWSRAGENAARATRWTNRVQEAYRRWVLRDHVRFILKVLRDAGEGALLDIGCAGGSLLAELKANHIEAKGLDTSEEAVEHARRQYGLECQRGDLFSNPYGIEKFSVVTMFHVLEHVETPGASLREARNILRPRGHLIVQIPNLDSWQFKLLRKNWYGLDVPRHLVNLRASTLKNLLQREGFVIRRVKHFSLRDNAAALVSSLFPFLDPMGRMVARRAQSNASSRHSTLEFALNLLYFLLWLAATPFCLIESAFRRGATVMVDAQLREV